jgi:hypothetical protein
VVAVVIVDPHSGGVLEKGARNQLPERPYGCFAQLVPDTFFKLTPFSSQAHPTWAATVVIKQVECQTIGMLPASAEPCREARFVARPVRFRPIVERYSHDWLPRCTRIAPQAIGTATNAKQQSGLGAAQRNLSGSNAKVRRGSSNPAIFGTRCASRGRRWPRHGLCGAIRGMSKRSAKESFARNGHGRSLAARRAGSCNEAIGVDSRFFVFQP